MSKEKPKEFSKKCIGFVESDIFPNMCSHFCVYGKCNFFTHEDKPINCDDLIDKEGGS